MSEHDVISAADMIMNVFGNIERQEIEQSNKILKTWRIVIESINNQNAAKLSAHSRIIDLKNEILLVEVDHPGWIQLMQIYQKYILNGLRRYIPDLKISSLAFRMRGSETKLADVNYAKEKEKKALEARLNAEEEALKKHGFSENSKTEKPLPDKLQNLFDRLKDDMLTKNK